MQPVPVAWCVVAGMMAAFMLPAAAEKFAPVPEPPAPVKDYQRPANPPEPETDGRAVPEPEVVVTTRGEDQYEEYRIGGRVYMIKVTPKRGAPYYLVDQNGQGQFERTDLNPDFRPPMWVIKRF